MAEQALRRRNKHWSGQIHSHRKHMYFDLIFKDALLIGFVSMNNIPGFVFSLCYMYCIGRQSPEFLLLL